MAKDPHDKANLEMTLEDHLALGSTPLQVLRNNPGKTLAETMNDAELSAFIRREVEMVAEVFERAKRSGDQRDNETLLRIALDGFLVRNIAYLREIGRLPTEFADLDPVARFALDE